MTEDTLHIKKLFRQLSIKDLNNRIESFRKFVDLRSFSEERIKTELLKIFTIEYHGKPAQFFLSSHIETPDNQIYYYYRIREFTEKDYIGLSTKKFPSIQTKQDVWYKPDSDVKNYGRLNRPGKSVLYVSSQSVNAVYEKECKIGDYFFILIYRSKRRNMRISQIHNIPYIDELTEEENAKRIIMHNFLFSEFTKYVSEGREYLYKTSLLIYETFFNNPFIDGFSYPSIASDCKMGYNICFSQEKADLNLSLVCVMVCQLHPPTEHSEFCVNPIYDGILNDDNTISFYDYNSDYSLSKIGDYNMIRKAGIL